MKVGDLVLIERAYGSKGIIIAMRKEMYRTDLVCDVWLYELDDSKDTEGKRKIYTFMQSQLEVISEGA